MSKNVSVTLAVIFAVLTFAFTLLLCLSATAGTLWSVLMLVCFLLMAGCIARYTMVR